MKTYQYYGDAGHGWLRVRYSEIENDLDKYTNCSFKKGRYAYLEHDLDAGVFLKAYKEANGEYPNIKTHNTEISKIRDYPRLKIG